MATFCQKLKLLQTASNFTYIFLEVIPINSISFMNFGELWEMSKFHPFSKVRALSAFFCQKLKLLQTAPNFTCMFLEVIPINSVSFMNFGELWFHPKCQNFILFLRSGAVGIFLSKIETSPNCFKFHMHVPGGDSNKFCQKFILFLNLSFMNFGELWENVKISSFLRSGTVGNFLSKIETSPNCFKFHIHVPGGDSNKFCKFHEFGRTLRNVKISSYF